MEVISSKANKHNPTPTHDDKKRKRARNICLAAIVIVLAFIALLVILFFTLFKPKHPVTTVNSIDLRDLQVPSDFPRVRLDLNLTLNVNLSIKNPNKASFKYGNDSTSLIYYKKDVVAEGIIPAGKISSDETKVFNIEVRIFADRLIGNPEVYSDVISGKLPFTTYTRISGRISVLHVFKRHIVTYSWCDISIDVVNRSIEKSHCKYKTKL